MPEMKVVLRWGRCPLVRNGRAELSLKLEENDDGVKVFAELSLDEKYASVILRRYVEDTGNADGVFVIRDGERIPYADLVKEVEMPDE